MDNKETLEKLNKFTRREMKEDEVYIFDVVLCDNEIDRDGERFSLNALKSLEKLFVGKTGIFDHDPQSSKQTARIFDVKLLSDTSRTTAAGESYTYLKASAYMVKTDGNENLIKEIDGGIKKEVSISCCAGSKKCSVCGTDLNKKKCPHSAGKNYKGKVAHAVLDDITDAYEWSFVAVPAQVNAGVTKKYVGYAETLNEENARLVEKLCDMVRADIYRLCLASGSSAYTKALTAASEKMNAEELIGFKKILEKEHRSKSISQLNIDTKGFDEFRMEGINK